MQNVKRVQNSQVSYLGTFPENVTTNYVNENNHALTIYIFGHAQSYEYENCFGK